MKRLSLKTWELIGRLHDKKSVWQRIIGREEEPQQIFEQIASSDEALAIPHLTDFLVNDRKEIREAASRTIGHLLSQVESSEFAQLDEACRNYYTYPSASIWIHLKPNALNQLWQLPNAGIVLGLASFHNSGFIRQAAINELTKITVGSEIPFLLLRLNDWVEVVRKSATMAVMHRIHPGYETHFFHHLRLVFRLANCGRSQNNHIIAAVTSLLQQPMAMAILQEGIRSGDRWMRREAFRLAIGANSIESTALLKDMLSDVDPIIRLWAARNLVRNLDDIDVQPLLAVLIHDRFMPVRCTALGVLAERNFGNSFETLKNALFDSHASIRTMARYWIGVRDAKFDFASAYRQALQDSSGARRNSAILGLGETGAAEDAHEIAPFLNAPSVATRKAAIRAIARLDGDRYVSEFLKALICEFPGVSNIAMRALACRTGAIMQQLQSTFREQASPYGRKNVFRLLATQSLWPRGIFLFESLRDRDEQIVELGRKAISDWLAQTRRMAIAPNAKELEQLRNAFKASRGMLSAPDARELQFCLDSYR